MLRGASCGKQQMQSVLWTIARLVSNEDNSAPVERKEPHADPAHVRHPLEAMMWERSISHVSFRVKWAATPGPQWADARATSNCRISCLLPIDLHALRGQDIMGQRHLQGDTGFWQLPKKIFLCLSAFPGASPEQPWYGDQGGRCTSYI